jgi:MGT family glycosyltransferase
MMLQTRNHSNHIHNGDKMAICVFLPFPAYGPVNPTLAIAQALISTGQTVIYYLPEEFRETVEATGAIFRPYESQIFNSIASGTPTQAQEGRLVLPQVWERIRADMPDVIIHDPFSPWTTILVRALGLRAIFLHSSYPMNEHFNLSSVMADMSIAGDRLAQIRETMAKENAALAEVCETYHVAPIDYVGLAASPRPLNIVLIPQAFQPAGSSFDERYVFVGPSIWPRYTGGSFPIEQLTTEKPLLYISLGSIFTNQLLFFKTCFEAFADTSWQVVLSHGRSVDTGVLGSVPENFLLSAYAPQLDILERANVFVTHAGVNSAMESLFYGVPMVAIPQATVDQAITARLVAEMRLGVALSKADVTTERLREAVEHVADDEGIGQSVRRIQRLTREAGGYRRAAAAILRFVQVSGGEREDK